MTNWEIISLVIEIAGTVAVIVSLLYLAKQVKNGNALNRTSTFREIMVGLINQNNVMFGPENVELIAAGFKSYNLLSPVEKLRFDHLMSNFFQYPEDSWNSNQVELLSIETMDNWAWYLKTRMFPYPGVREFWTHNKFGYAPGFQNWVDSIIEQPDPAGDPYGLMGNESASEHIKSF